MIGYAIATAGFIAFNQAKSLDNAKVREMVAERARRASSFDETGVCRRRTLDERRRAPRHRPVSPRPRPRRADSTFDAPSPPPARFLPPSPLLARLSRAYSDARCISWHLARKRPCFTLGTRVTIRLVSRPRGAFAPGDGFGRREPLFRVRSARERASSARMVDAREDSRDDAPLRHSDDQISSVATDATERPARDVGFKRAFVTCVVVTLAGGGLAFTGVSADGEIERGEALKRVTPSCHAENGSGTRRRSLLASGDVPDDAEVGASLSDARPYVIAAVLGAVALGTCALALFRRHPRATTWGMIYVKIASLATLSVMLFSQGSILGGVLFALFAGFFAWMRRRGIASSSWRNYSARRRRLCGIIRI